MQFFHQVAPVVAVAQDLSSVRNKIKKKSTADVGIKQIMQYLHLGMNNVVVFDTKIKLMVVWVCFLGR